MQQMAAAARADRLERMTNLVLVLLETQRPLSLREIASTVVGYPEGKEASRQAFERDKRALRDLGIPISVEPLAGEEQLGYRIRPEDYYLPELRLDAGRGAGTELRSRRRAARRRGRSRRRGQARCHGRGARARPAPDRGSAVAARARAASRGRARPRARAFRLPGTSPRGRAVRAHVQGNGLVSRRARPDCTRRRPPHVPGRPVRGRA